VKASDLSVGAQRNTMNAALGLCSTWQAILGAPEFGSAIVGLREFRGATRSIFLMPAKRWCCD
jgi:hypothetical protein